MHWYCLFSTIIQHFNNAIIYIIYIQYKFFSLDYNPYRRIGIHLVEIRCKITFSCPKFI